MNDHADNNTKIYCFSGLGADERVFQHIRLSLPYQVLTWTQPSPDDSFHSYLQQYISQIDKNADIVLIGVSFGGVVAQELAKLIPVKKIILISSIESHKSIPWNYYILKPFLSFIPTKYFSPPFAVIKNKFGVKDKKSSNLLKEIVNDTDPVFSKWAIKQLLTWRCYKSETPIVCIHGSKDRVLPSSPRTDYLIPDAGHFAIVDNADQVSTFINKALENT